LATYKNIFFDLDRTIWDFDKNSAEALTEIVNEFNLTSQVPEISEFISSYNFYNERLWDFYRKGKIKKYLLRHERFRLLLHRFGIDDKELVEKISKYYLHAAPNKRYLIENAPEVLEYLSLKYKLYIISNGFYDVQLTKLINSGISKYFAKVFTSDRIGYSKPNVHIFDYAIRSTHSHKEESIMIGDDEVNDIQGARNAHIDQVFFNPDGEEVTIPPTFEIKNLLELKEMF
jgi:putative hydrolase of the HAD superfamily